MSASSSLDSGSYPAVTKGQLPGSVPKPSQSRLTEALLRVGDKDSSIGGSLHGTEDTGTSRGAVKSDVEERLEGAGALLVGLRELESTIGLGLSLVLVGEAELGESAASDEKSGSVSGGPVGQTVVDAVAGELVRVGGSKNKVTLELGRDDLRWGVGVSL